MRRSSRRQASSALECARRPALLKIVRDEALLPSTRRGSRNGAGSHRPIPVLRHRWVIDAAGKRTCSSPACSSTSKAGNAFRLFRLLCCATLLAASGNRGPAGNLDKPWPRAEHVRGRSSSSSPSSAMDAPRIYVLEEVNPRASRTYRSSPRPSVTSGRHRHRDHGERRLLRRAPMAAKAYDPHGRRRRRCFLRPLPRASTCWAPRSARRRGGPRLAAARRRPPPRYAFARAEQAAGGVHPAAIGGVFISVGRRQAAHRRAGTCCRTRLPPPRHRHPAFLTGHRP